MDVRALKDFEKEIRTERNHELEVERKTNEYLARILPVGESQLWEKSELGITVGVSCQKIKRQDYLR